MLKIIDFTLTDEAINELDDAIKHDVHREVRERSKVIKQLHLGRKVAEVAEIFCVSQPTIYNWWKRYDRLGVSIELTKKPTVKDREMACRLSKFRLFLSGRS